MPNLILINVRLSICCTQVNEPADCKSFGNYFKLILYICFQFYNWIVNMVNILTHTKQLAFHAPITSGVYSVGFDVFTFSRPRRRPVF